MPQENTFMTVDEVAEYLRLPVSTVYYLAQKQLLPGFKVGKHWRFKRSSILEWIDEQEKKSLTTQEG